MIYFSNTPPRNSQLKISIRRYMNEKLPHLFNQNFKKYKRTHDELLGIMTFFYI